MHIVQCGKEKQMAATVGSPLLLASGLGDKVGEQDIKLEDLVCCLQS